MKPSPRLLHKQKSALKEQWRQEVKCVPKLQTPCAASHIKMTKDGNLLFMSLPWCTPVNPEKHPFILTMRFSQFPRWDQSFILLKMTVCLIALWQQKTLRTAVYTRSVQNIRSLLLILSSASFTWSKSCHEAYKSLFLFMSSLVIKKN